MVAEKQFCQVRARVRGPGGHGALPMRGGAMAKLARAIERLDRRRLPVHITPVVRRMFETIAAALPLPLGLVIGQLLNPGLTDRVLNMLGQRAHAFDPLLHNTVNATVVRGGEKINVVPSEIVLDMDGRLLPGYGPDDLLAELRQVLGAEVELEIAFYEPGPPEPDMGLFGTLAGILRAADPQGIPTPMLLSGVTDGRFFARLGIQTYGFLPMRLPPEFNFTATIHAADERIPVEALGFGADAVYQVLRRFG
jgi:acetylornithine deacetylase/succinyl-diaminopimelate desuccinylase-like protein